MPQADVVGDKIHVVTEWHDRDVMTQVPGAKYKGGHTWAIPLNWAGCLILRGLFGSGLEVGAGLQKWSWREYETRIQPALELRERLQLPPGHHMLGLLNLIEEGTDLRLKPYQGVDVAFLALCRQALLTNDMGLGKTAVALRTIQVLREMGENPFPILIVCPNSLKVSVWEREAAAWAPEIRVQVVHGGAAVRRKQLATEADMFVINWEALRLHSRLAPYGSIAMTDTEKQPKELNKMGLRTVILDEAHRLNHPGASKQCRAAWSVMHQAEFRFGLTGTPVADHAGDLWGLEHGILPDWFPAKTKYMDRYCTPPDSPILMADASLKSIGQIEVGDKVIGFSRENTPGSIKMQEATVIAVHRHTAEIVQLTTKSGATFKCTPDHLWLDYRRYLKNDIEKTDQRGNVATLHWRLKDFWPVCECGMITNTGNMSHHLKATNHCVVIPARSIPAELKPLKTPRKRAKFLEFRRPSVGMGLVKIVTIPPALTREQEQLAWWLGGIYDGEGASTNISQNRKANPDIYAKIEYALKELGFSYTANDYGFNLLGGRDTLIRFINYCHPVKMPIRTGKRKYQQFLSLIGKGYHHRDEIVSIKPAGQSEVVSLTTTTGTYIVHGYASSNCEMGYNFFGGQEILGLKTDTQQEFRKITDPTWRRIPKAAALPQLPKWLPDQFRHTPMAAKQAKMYGQMEDELIAQLDDGYIAAASSLAKMTRLLQFASASAVLEEVEPGSNKLPNIRLAMPSGKVDDLMDLLEEMGDKPLVVTAVSRQLIELAAQRLSSAGISHGLITGSQSPDERATAKDAFQAGKIRVILMTLGAGAEGLTLTRADTILFMQESWRAQENDQARGRIDRIGAEGHQGLQAIIQITPDTVEEGKVTTLANKASRIEEVLQDRAALERILRRPK